ncbi:hypothetical protein F5Y19DRAFT_340453 [Xylariaceae sp. FL1651]|nr:hypothetical protein F5Y19DRAFT_340453 [Xylariaceae sp. FL1651]
MSRKPPFQQSFEIFCDSSSGENDNSLRDYPVLTPTISKHLRHLSIFQSQNHQIQQIRAGAGIRELSKVHNSHWDGPRKNTKKKNNTNGRLTRPPITSNTFEILETVPESESQAQPATTASSVSDDTQQVFQLPVEQYSSHPLSIAACNIPPLEEQLVKHRGGWFEWILAVRVPVDPESQHDTGSELEGPPEARKVYFGCNLLPKTSQANNCGIEAACPPGSYLLLVTPLEPTEEVLEVFRDPVGNSDMALPDVNIDPGTPTKTSDCGPEHRAEQITPQSTVCTRGDDSFAETITSRSPADPVARIEDSFEALDKLEEQLEAFDKVAHFNQYGSAKEPASVNKASADVDLVKNSPTVRFATPQPKRGCSKTGSASLRVRPATEPGRPALRKSTSMMLDSPKLKAEDKALLQAPPKPVTVKGVSSLFPPKQLTKSTKQPTVPTFELPGDAVARELKEKKEARLASQRATQPTAASLRRAKSARLPIRPAFELPGEAISRRKREEHEAQLKAQGEEERRRREFKARPIPSKVMSATVPRETIASRARQNKAVLTENSDQTSTPSKHVSTTTDSNLRPALSSANNRPQSRGRGLKAERASTQDSRATSTSTGSVSGKRSSVSVEDIQMQKLRGHEIYQRDNSWTDSRIRDKREREALAKLAREEAAERSRQQSREWAAKQAKKRMTVGSLRDVMA